MKKYVYITFIYLSMAYKVYWLNRKYTRKLIKEIDQVLQKRGHALSTLQKKRIKFYTIQSSITNSWFSTLRGKKPTRKEKIHAVCLGAITPLLDDLTDTLKFTSCDILNELNRPDETNADTILAVRYLYTQLKKYSKEGFYGFFEQALIAQDASLKQLEEKKLNEQELKTITYKKGGSWTLLYRAILSNPLQNGEQEAIYSLGYLLQLTNDMFDIYKDYQNKQQTLYTNSTDFQQIDHEYRTSYHKMKVQFLNLEYDYHNVQQFLCETAIIISRGMVCSDQLLQVQKKKSGRMNIEKCTRKELICDMEKPANMLKSINYSVNFCRQIKLQPVRNGD